jgi:phosphonopyruvate decarboxylase
MMHGRDFISAARTVGLDFYASVPCSYLTPLLNAVLSDDVATHLGAANEGDAVGIAAGAWLAGHGTVVMAQNSGLGNMINPLTSLNHPFRIPTLAVVTWRGRPGETDEPQHEVMGRTLFDVLQAIEIPAVACATDAAALATQIAELAAAMTQDGRPRAIVVPKGTFAAAECPPGPPRARPHVPALPQPPGGAPRLTRWDALETILGALPSGAAVIATTGMTGRELFTLSDGPQHFYLVGSMGCAGAVGLGVAIHVRRPVVVIDGDGALLMRMGTLATIGAAAPENLVHVLLDNGVHDSTGGQPTVSGGVNWGAIALGCGYARAAVCSTAADIAHALQAGPTTGPVFLHVPIVPGSRANVGRPKVPPWEVAHRFRAFLAEPPP